MTSAAAANAPARRWIGGGNIAAILGISPFSTPLREYMKITGQAPELSKEDEEFFEGRRDLEPFVRNKLRRRYNAELVAQNVRYTDPEFEWMKAEIDAEENAANWEIKTASQWAAKQWGETETDDFPPYVAAQAMWGLMIRPKAYANIAPCIGFDEIRRYRLEPDADMIQLLRTRAVRFWNEHVVPMVPPPPMDLDDASVLWPKSIAKTVVANEQTIAHVASFESIKAAIKTATEEGDMHKLAIQTAMGEADTLLRPDGAAIATWKSPKDSIAFDAVAYSGHLEGVIHSSGIVVPESFSTMREKFTNPKPNARRLLLK